MTMENRELGDKILKNVRNKIVVSNLEREENMKLSRRKQIISLCATVMMVLSGGFLTVNAATEGKLVEDIKQKYEEMIVVKLDHDNYEVTTQKDEKGEEHVIYTIHPQYSEEMQFDVNKDALEGEKLEVEIKENEEGAEMTFYNYE